MLPPVSKYLAHSRRKNERLRMYVQLVRRFFRFHRGNLRNCFRRNISCHTETIRHQIRLKKLVKNDYLQAGIYRCRFFRKILKNQRRARETGESRRHEATGKNLPYYCTTSMNEWTRQTDENLVGVCSGTVICMSRGPFSPRAALAIIQYKSTFIHTSGTPPTRKIL